MVFNTMSVYDVPEREHVKRKRGRTQNRSLGYSKVYPGMLSELIVNPTKMRSVGQIRFRPHKSLTSYANYFFKPTEENVVVYGIKCSTSVK